MDQYEGGDLDPEIIQAMLREIIEGESGPSLKQMREDPNLAKLLKDPKEGNPVIGKMMKVLRSTPKVSCVAPVSPPCLEQPINSHSIQKGAALTFLADASSHVMMFQVKPSFDERPKARVERVGINEATTFPGLCNKHDTDLFEKIERVALIPPSDEQLFLLSYRSVLRECYAKRCQAERAQLMAKTFVNDETLSPYVKKLLRILAYGPYVGAVHMDNVQENYNALYRLKAFSTEQNPDSLVYVNRVIDERTAFAVASYFTPFFNLDGGEIPFGGPKKLMPFMTLNVVPSEDHTVVSLAYVQRFESPIAGIIHRINEASTNEIFLDRIWELALRNCENLVIAPDAWVTLPVPDRTDVEDFFTSTIGHRWQPWPDLRIPRFN